MPITGRPPKPPLTYFLRRLAEFTDRPDECWDWPGATSKGYGAVNIRVAPGVYRNRAAHRLAYEALAGPVPEGLDLDHLCRNRRCMNPRHLEPVTRSVNLRRGAVGDARRARPKCESGHPYSDATSYRDSRGYRVCRICKRERKRRAYHKRRRDAA